MVQNNKSVFGGIFKAKAKAVAKRQWGMDVQSFWVPVMTAARVTGELSAAECPDSVLGAPIRVGRDENGDVLFDSKGAIKYVVDKSFRGLVRNAQENFAAQMQETVATVRKAHPTQYNKQVAAQQAAGVVLIEDDKAAIEAAYKIPALVEGTEPVTEPVGEAAV